MLAQQSKSVTETAFIHASAPHPAITKANRHNKQASNVYRENGELEAINGNISNMMFDPRVKRGNTYSAEIITQSSQIEAERLHDEVERKKVREVQKKRRVAAARRSSTPPPVEGRSHMDCQTESVMEVLRDRPIETDATTQTISALDRPTSPLFVPSSCGVDKYTQVIVGELFDFDLEVKPLLQALIGRTLEVSLIEVMQEEELASIQRHRERFEEERNAELAELQRLEAEAKRKFAEKARRLEQEKLRVKEQEELRQKIAARSFARQCLADLHSKVYDSLEASGELKDPRRVEIEQKFMPWLFMETEARVDRRRQAEDLLNQILTELSAP